MPLRKLVFLDCGQFLAGPVVSMYAAALGARVIKVERPRGGDDSRAIGPFEKSSGEGSYFMSVNRGKESLTLDLSKPEGQQIFRRLAGRADVLVENFRPGVMDKLNLGHASLQEANPGLIYATATGFGQTGPHATRPAFDSILQAAGGLISVTGTAPTEQGGGELVRVGASVIDFTAGLNTLAGVLAALYQRSQTGLGQRVDCSMLATTVGLMENAVARHR
jgi:CoA:oxalate CoA-transferase